MAYATFADPTTLRPSEHNIRYIRHDGADYEDTADVDERMVRNVAEFGIVQPPLARYEDDELRVLDGMRRVRAAARAGFDRIPLVVREDTDTEALADAIVSHTDGFQKPVSDRDRESALRASVDGPNRPLREWEQSDEIADARYRLGLDSDADQIARELSAAHGVGRATAEALAETIGGLEDVREASETRLQETPGVGPAKAEQIRLALAGAVRGYRCSECGWESTVAAVDDGDPICGDCRTAVNDALIPPCEEERR